MSDRRVNLGAMFSPDVVAAIEQLVDMLSSDELEIASKASTAPIYAWVAPRTAAVR